MELFKRVHNPMVTELVGVRWLTPNMAASIKMEIKLQYVSRVWSFIFWLHKYNKFILF